MSRKTLGSLLHSADKAAVLARYTYRYTREHVPAWATKPRPDGTSYPIQFDSDADWLSNTLFPVNKNGRLRDNGDCESYPTWPDMDTDHRGIQKHFMGD